MKERVFLDTNVLVYADDLDAGTKTQRARELLGGALRDQNGVLSSRRCFKSSSWSPRASSASIPQWPGAR